MLVLIACLFQIVTGRCRPPIVGCSLPSCSWSCLRTSVSVCSRSARKCSTRTWVQSLRRCAQSSTRSATSKASSSSGTISRYVHTHTHTLCLHFSSHFPDGPGLAVTRMSPLWILWHLRVMQVVVTTGAIRRAKLQSECHHQQTNTQLFLQAGCPSCRPTNECMYIYYDYDDHHYHHQHHHHHHHHHHHQYSHYYYYSHFWFSFNWLIFPEVTPC